MSQRKPADIVEFKKDANRIVLLAESALLGSLMLDARAFGKVRRLVSEADFIEPKHRFIFRAVVHLQQRGALADVIAVADFLEERGHKQFIDLAYLGMMAKDTPSAANVMTYARIVKKHALMRKGLKLVRHYAHLLQHPGEYEVTDIINQLSNAAFVLQQEAESAHDD